MPSLLVRVPARLFAAVMLLFCFLLCEVANTPLVSSWASPVQQPYGLQRLQLRQGTALQGSVVILLNQARLAEQQANSLQAYLLWEQVLEKEPTHSIALQSSGLHCEQLAEQAAASHDVLLERYWLQQACVHYERLVNLKPKVTSLTFRLALLYSQLQAPQQAWPWYQKALKAYPKVASLHFNAANVLQSLGQATLAGAHYEQAVLLDRHLIAAYNNWALLKETQQDVKGAELLYKKALQYNKTYGLAHLNLGSLYLEQHRWQEAKAHFSQVLLKEPSNVTALLGEGQAAMALGLHSEALNGFKQAIAVEPDNSEALYWMARTYLELHQWPQAMLACQAYLAKTPEGPYHNEIKTWLRAASTVETGKASSL